MNLNTGNIYAGGSIRIGSISIHPSKAGRQNCNNPEFQTRYAKYIETGFKNYKSKVNTDPEFKKEVWGIRRKWKDENREKINEQQRIRHHKNREKDNEYKKAWRAKRKTEGITTEKEYAKKYYEKNKELISQKDKERRQKDPEKYKEQNRKYYKKMKELYPEREKERSRQKYIKRKERMKNATGDDPP